MSTPSARPAYFPHVDGLRAIAVLSVLVYHVNPTWLPGGFAGVDIFFVISGFIVSASVGSLERIGLPKFILYFYARRLQRIAPALIVCLLVTTAAATVLLPSAWLSNAHQQTGFYAFFGLSNFILARSENDYFSPIAEFNPYTHTWSLGIEEQFYFIFPFLFFAWTFGGKWRRLTSGLFCVGLVVSLGYSAWLGQTDKTSAFYMITSRFWELAAGVLLFQFMSLSGRRFDTAQQASPKWFTPAAAVSLLLVAYGFAVSHPQSFPFPGGLPSVLGALGLLGFLHGQSRDNPVVRVLASRPALFIGAISYSLYLWHWPVLVLFRWTVGAEALVHQVAILLLSFALATASYYWVETPVRHNGVLRRLPRYAVVAVGLLCVGSSALVARKVSWSQERISVNTVARHAQDWYPNRAEPVAAYPGCVVKESRAPLAAGFIATYTRENCDHPVDAPSLFAIGDSHNMAYAALYKGYAMETGAKVTVYNNDGCPVITLLWQVDRCRTHSDDALNDLIGRIGAGDVVFLASLRMPRFADQYVRFDDADVKALVFSPAAAATREAAVTQARGILQRLHATGARVVVEGPKPVFRSPTFRCAHAYNDANPICSEGTQMDRTELEQLRAPTLDALTALAAGTPDVGVWDPFTVLCPQARTCSAFRDGRPLFFDGDHLSGYGNRLLLPSFRKFVVDQRFRTRSLTSDSAPAAYLAE